jgi:hypothetical protein
MQCRSSAKAPLVGSETASPLEAASFTFMLVLLLFIVFGLPYTLSLASIQYHELPTIENMTIRINRFTPESVLLQPLPATTC